VLFGLTMIATVALGYAFYGYYSNVFTADDGASAAAAADREREFAAPENSIAVLPFTDLSEDGSQGYFSEGISEEILNLLAQVKGLHVAARTSSFVFQGGKKDIREIGRLLNVRTVLEGSIRKAGDRIRMTAQLINVEDGYHIWSKSYDRKLDDVFAIQDEVAGAIASALVESFSGLKHKDASRTSSLAAFEAYRTGRLHWWRRSPEQLKKAVTLFAQAVENDPRFAPAYAAMADSWLLLSDYGNLTVPKAIERAMPRIEQALEIDPESAEAFAALGLARWKIGQKDAAESALRQALSLDENYVPAYLWLAGLLGEVGRLPEQHQVLQKAMAIDPLNEMLAVNYSNNFAQRGDYKAARDLLLNLISVRPDSPTLLRSVSGISLESGDLAGGWRYAEQAYELEPNSPIVILTLANAWLTIGELGKAEDLLAKGLLEASDNNNLRDSYFFVLLQQKRLEEAGRFIDEAVEGKLDDMPESLQQLYDLQKGLIRLVAGDSEAARSFIERAVRDDSAQAWDGNQIFVQTISALLQRQAGHAEIADARLASAERAVRRARLNGADNAYLHYAESGINALRGNVDAALESLRTAYDRGFRNAWLMDIDSRLDPLRSEPRFIALKQQIESDLSRARSEVMSSGLAQG